MSRNEQVANLIKELGAEFLSKNDNRTSLITVSGCSISPDLKRATILITVLPENKEENAVNFIRRQLGDMRDFIKKNVNMKVIPYLEVQIDKGEKHRQRIDELLKEK